MMIRPPGQTHSAPALPQRQSELHSNPRGLSASTELRSFSIPSLNKGGHTSSEMGGGKVTLVKGGVI